MKSKVSRRELIKGALAAEAAAIIGCSSQSKTGAAPSTVLENQHQGTSEWMLTKTRIDPKTKYRCPCVEGYCSRTSLRPGEELSIHVSTNPASTFTLDIYRLGYYGGLGGRHMISL